MRQLRRNQGLKDTTFSSRIMHVWVLFTRKRKTFIDKLMQNCNTKNRPRGLLVWWTNWLQKYQVYQEVYVWSCIRDQTWNGLGWNGEEPAEMEAILLCMQNRNQWLTTMTFHKWQKRDKVGMPGWSTKITPYGYWVIHWSAIGFILQSFNWTEGEISCFTYLMVKKIW